jgi:hypothetical protein
MKKYLLIIPILFFLQSGTASAARLFTSGIELASTSAGVEFASLNNTPTINTTTVHSGAKSLEISGSIATTVFEYERGTFTAGATIYARTYVYIDSQDDSASVVTTFELYSTATNVVNLQCSNVGGTYTCTPWYNSFGGSTSTFTISPDTWTMLEIFYDTSPADGSEVLTIRKDGSSVSTSSALTFTTKTVNTFGVGVYNGTAGTISGTTVYYDDIAINDSANPGQSSQTSYPGEGKVAVAVPTGAGASACTSGTYDDLDEIPPTDAGSSPGVEQCELDVNPTNGLFNMTDSSTLGIDSYDTITLVEPLLRVREDTSGTTNYTIRVNSNGGTASVSASVDAGNLVVRTNNNSTTSFTNRKTMYRDPTTLTAWTPTGTNSIDSMQCGAGTTDGSPDTWIKGVYCLVEWVDGTAPVSQVKTGASIIWMNE